MDIKIYTHKIKEFFSECIRVLKITKKPTRDEYKVVVKVAGLGMILIGLIGFVIVMIKVLLFER